MGWNMQLWKKLCLFIFFFFHGRSERSRNSCYRAQSNAPHRTRASRRLCPPSLRPHPAARFLPPRRDSACAMDPSWGCHRDHCALTREWWGACTAGVRRSDRSARVRLKQPERLAGSLPAPHQRLWDLSLPRDPWGHLREGHCHTWGYRWDKKQTNKKQWIKWTESLSPAIRLILFVMKVCQLSKSNTY